MKNVVNGASSSHSKKICLKEKMYVSIFIACQIVLIDHCQTKMYCLHSESVFVSFCFVFRRLGMMCVCALFIENKLQFKLISILFTDRIYLGIQTHTLSDTQQKRE